MAAPRRALAAGCATVTVAAVCSVAAGWSSDEPTLDRGDARAVAAAAFARMGVDAPRTATRVDAGERTAPDGSRRAVWLTSTAAPGFDGRVELSVDRSTGALVHLDDRDDTGRLRLLRDDQFDRLDGFHANPARDRRQRRDQWSTVAAAAVVGVALGLARDPALRRAPGGGGRPAPVGAP